MIDIYKNKETDNFDIDISVDEWKEILSLPAIREANNVLYALEQWYNLPNNMGSCKMLEQLTGIDYRFFSNQNCKLGKTAVKHLDRFRLIKSDGKETYWAIAWQNAVAKQVDGAWIIRLRAELVEAIESIGLFEKRGSMDINDYLQSIDFETEEKFEFSHKRRDNPLQKDKTIRVFPRGPAAAKNALLHASFQCEYDASHASFPRSKDGKPYMETHHLVPIHCAGDYAASVDVPENIVCLCSTCHNRIHYGQDRNILIEQLWELRNADLCKVGIRISLSELIVLYADR